MIALQNKTNYVNSKTDNTHEDCKCQQCGDWDETVNHIKSECRKLEEKNIQEKSWLSGKDSPEIVIETEIGPNWQMV